MVPLYSASVFLCTVTALYGQDYNNLGQVVFSHIIFRHGERMPLEFYPNDPHKDSPKWPFEIAQLTDEGRKEEFELGRWLRRRYSQLVSLRYKASEIFAQSTDIDRTLMSAQSCLAGFYAPTDSQDPDLSWPSVPVHTVPIKDDSLLGAAVTYPCPVFNSEMSRVFTLPKIKALQEKFKYIYDYLSNHTGKEVRNFDSALRIYDTLAIEEKYNFSLPDWSLFIYPEPVREIGLYSFVLPTWTTLLKRLKIGPLLKDMVGHFEAKRAGTLSPDRKLWFYSAHDVTVASLLNSLEAFDIQFPPYAACVLFELRVIDKDYFVTLSYHNNTKEEPHLLPILSCGSFCPLDQFVALVEPLLPQDWDEECQLPAAKYFCFIIAVASLSFVLVCALVAFIIVRFLRQSSCRNYSTMSSPSSDFHSKTNPGLINHSYTLP